ncbi:hypothetical protein F5Y06DRAFT_108359 [Hypoxylon sp. FL0890]|nr:hypothetical protein F5Y06DRAFT_108359 [Hypoxylon sp. FL0890]
MNKNVWWVFLFSVIGMRLCLTVSATCAVCSPANISVGWLIYWARQSYFRNGLATSFYYYDGTLLISRLLGACSSLLSNCK